MDRDIDMDMDKNVNIWVNMYINMKMYFNCEGHYSAFLWDTMIIFSMWKGEALLHHPRRGGL